MGRKSKQLKDYLDLAAASDLEFLDPVSPRRTSVPCRWRCRQCQRLLRKSYNDVRQSPCVCRTSKTLKVTDYEQLAQRFGLEWRGKTLPKTNKVVTLWYSSATESMFEASYAQLSYDKIPKRFKVYITDGT